MGGLNWPNYAGFITQCWGSPSIERVSQFYAGSNVVLGSNPPYFVNDFLAFYPKFGGNPANLQGTLTSGSATIASVSTQPIAQKIQPGQLVTGSGIPANTFVVSATTGSIVTSQPATASGEISLLIYIAPFVPLIVLQIYIAAATSSLVQARWDSMWMLAMSWYVAHFATLYMRSEGNIYCNAGQAATAGLKVGITVSQGAGSAAQGLQLVTGLEDWAAWTTTSYGIQFATQAKVIGGGPMHLL